MATKPIAILMWILFGVVLFVICILLAFDAISRHEYFASCISPSLAENTRGTEALEKLEPRRLFGILSTGKHDTALDDKNKLSENLMELPDQPPGLFKNVAIHGNLATVTVDEKRWAAYAASHLQAANEVEFQWSIVYDLSRSLEHGTYQCTVSRIVSPSGTAIAENFLGYGF